jgi:Flp pilus assembly protein TadB
MGRDSRYPAEVDSTGSAPRPEEATRSGKLWRYLAVYTALRVGLVIALTALLAFFMPLIVALLFAIIVQLPLSWLLFSTPRSRVNDALAVSTARRRQERERLQAALSGEPAPPGGPARPGGPPVAGQPPSAVPGDPAS